MTNCPNCGAPVTVATCEYCGTIFPRQHSDEARTLLELKQEHLQQNMVIKQLYEDAIFAMRAYSSGIFTRHEAREIFGKPQI